MPSENKGYVPRVTQLDSVDLDKEIVQVLKTQVSNISKATPGSFLDSLEPEINALLRFYIWKFSVHQTRSTFGQQLLNLQYEGKFTGNKSYVWCLFSIVPSYLIERLDNDSLVHQRSQRLDTVCKVIKLLNVSLRIASFLNLLMFLKDGKYPSVIERILQIRLVSSSTQQRSLGYTYMTRELLWHTLIELLGNMIPLLNYHSLQRKVFGIFSKTQKKHLKTVPAVLHLGDKCTACKESLILPHHMGCSHVYCYYCLQGNLLANKNFECLACGYAPEYPKVIPVPYIQTRHVVNV